MKEYIKEKESSKEETEEKREQDLKDRKAIDFLRKSKVNVNEMSEEKPKIQNVLDTIPKNSKGGVKADYGKLQWSLVPWDSLENTVRVLMMGAEKYDADNWMKVERKRYVDAMMRHITQWLNGEAIDQESGLPHLSHAQCNMLFLNHLYGKEPFNRSE